MAHWQSYKNDFLASDKPRLEQIDCILIVVNTEMQHIERVREGMQMQLESLEAEAKRLIKEREELEGEQ